ncbi:hypothetical protein EGT07_23890 [Herbaspirillum sp. HC18]|nr:hypothetical protein EGT07_23890 [Herbaspirillum sp. HC18]
MIRLWEDGKLVPRWQRNRLKPVIGEFRLEEYKDEHMRRTMRIARVLDLSSRGRFNLIQPLADAAIISILDNRMTVSGIERYEAFASVMQSWMVEIISVEKSRTDDCSKV